MGARLEAHEQPSFTKHCNPHIFQISQSTLRQYIAPSHLVIETILLSPLHAVSHSQLAMVEPVGATLGAAGLLRPIFDTCRDLYKGYQLTRAFGKDSNRANCALKVQTARFEEISRWKLGYLRKPMDPNDPQDPITKAVRDQLVLMKGYFDEINRLLKHYKDLGM